jgi:fluoride exporter
MKEALAVALGAASGGLLRWQVGLWLNPKHAWLPLGTLAVNVAGGLLVGALLVLLARPEHQLWKLLLVTGFLGGLTTFSAFSGESLHLLQRGAWVLALAHSMLHVLGALGAAVLGAWLARVAQPL